MPKKLQEPVIRTNTITEYAKNCKQNPLKCGCRGSDAMCLKEWVKGDCYHPNCSHPPDAITDIALRVIGSSLVNVGLRFSDFSIHTGFKTTVSIYRNIGSEDEILIITRKKGTRYYTHPEEPSTPKTGVSS